MERLVVADTEVIIDFFSDCEPSAQVVADLIQKDCLVLTSISVFEVYAVVLGSSRLAQIDDLVSALRVLSFRAGDALAAVGIYGELRKERKTDRHTPLFHSHGGVEGFGVAGQLYVTHSLERFIAG